MKKLKLLFFSFTFALALNSCEDAYKITQDGELNEEVAIISVEDMQAYLNAIYGRVSVSNEVGFTAIFTDETGTGRGSGGQNFDTHRFQLTAANGYASAIWYGHYAAINRANRLIKAAEAITPATADEATYKSILAQTKAIRAFAHFQLLTYFSTDLKNDNAEGVILMDHVPSVGDDLPRNTNGEVFALIESDLAYAYDNITDQTYKYISKRFIDGLRARMYLYRGNYTLAQQYAEAVIAATPAANDLVNANPVPTSTVGSSAWNSAFYGNASTNPYRKMFNDSSQGEMILAMDRPNAGSWENIAGHFATNTTAVNGSPFFEVGRNLFNLLSATPGDVRRYACVDPTSLVNPNYDQPGVDYVATDVLIIDKYPGKTGAVLRNDIKVMRLSEIYLILAECYANSGNINGSSNSVASVLKLIRDKRNFLAAQALPNYADQTAALKDILLERRLELCFEGHRYIDLKRLGGIVNESIDRNITDDELQGLPLTIPVGDYRYTMPIPTDEINANGNIEQNPGY